MVTRLKEVDAVIIGVGWVGTVLARELTRAGLHVVGLERGPRRAPSEDFTLPGIRDELKYAVRGELFQDPQMETLTLRQASSETALPMRRFGAFLPGDGLGGAGSHWNGMHWRYTPFDLAARSHLTARYGAKAIPEHMPIQDFGVSYEELEPYYDRFEKLCGVSGKAGNLRGRKIAGGNIFEGSRSHDYPNPPLQRSLAGDLFATASAGLGYHPFTAPASNASQAYVNPEGASLGACAYCGHCERFGCEVNAKASPNSTLLPVLFQESRFDLRTHAYVRDLAYDRQARRVTAVRYLDTRSGEEFEQPAGLVILGAYVFSNTLLLRISGIGEPYDPATGQGVVGRNYCYQSGGGVQVFMEDREFNPFMGAGALSVAIDDFNGDNFDHGGLGFFGGALVSAATTGGRPIQTRPLPPGTPRWGREWKAATAKWYNRSFSIGGSGASYPHKDNYLDLDPTYRDALGRPLIRMTYNYRDNDRRLSAYVTDMAAKIARTLNPTHIASAGARQGDFSVIPYQTTHNTGGAVMGTNPKESVVNRYLQSWDAHNLFVIGASAFPQNASYNPTGTVGALSYWAAEAITKTYLKQPQALVDA